MDPMLKSRPQPHDILAVRTTVEDGVAVVELDGPVCAYTADHLDAELAKLVDDGPLRLVIDASNVRPLCSDGIDVLLAHEERCAARGGDLVLRGLRPGAQRVLDVLDLRRLVAPLAAV